LQTNLSNIESFNPPAWCLNGHVHTIACSLFSHPEKPSLESVKIATGDDDFLELNVIRARQKRPVIVLLHGLEGSANRYYIIELMKMCRAMNYSVVALNFRGCGSQLNKRRRFYHSGETNDLMTVFKWTLRQFPHSSIGAVGFSLGGNALLKSLAEHGDAHPAKAAVAVSVPYDLKLGAKRIQRGFTMLYEHLFIRSMTEKLRKKREIFPDLPAFEGSSLYQFDEQVTAPLHGFKSADDYYTRCSSNQFLPNIHLPTLLIHSKADPLCPPAMIPMYTIKQNPHIDYIITREGGHVGFRSSPPGWLNRTIANYFAEKID